MFITQGISSSKRSRILLRWCGFLLLFPLVLAISACGGSGDGIDPGVIDIPIAFIKRPIPIDDMGDDAQADIRDPRLFMTGGDVYLRSSSAVDATLTNISIAATGGTGDVKGLNANHEGTKLIFSLRLFDPDPNDDIVPTWNIYEYDLEDAELRQVIPGVVVPEFGDDLYPSYLPDGRILFTSNRQSGFREMQLREIKPRFSALDEDENTAALVLHVMDADGTNIRQISHNRSHDLYPQVLARHRSGRIVFSRWDNAVGNNEFNLYTANPDGSNMELLYGSRSHATGTNGANIQFTNIREMENGDLMVIARPFDGTFDGGDIVIIDIDRFADINKPVLSWAGLSGPAQVPATVTGVTTDDTISINGRYSSAFPIWDGSNRLLVSKSTCQVELNGEVGSCRDIDPLAPGAQERSPPYAIWLYDMVEDTEKPIVLAQAGTVITEVITFDNRTRGAVIFDKKLAGLLNPNWEDPTVNVGAVNIKSVYDMGTGTGTFNGCYFNVCTPAAGINSVQDFADPANFPDITQTLGAQRPARFVRFIKPVGIPDPDDPTLTTPPDLANTAFGLQRNLGMREIVGYAPVEPDGSVMVKVPANIPLALEVLDGEGRRIGPRHDNWFQVQPGDTVTCVGCHDPGNGGSEPGVHARSDGEAPSINSGVPPSQEFVNTLIPGGTSPDPYRGEVGQTMAEVRFATVAAINLALEPQLSVDLTYVDYWTDPDAPDLLLQGRVADPTYDYLYTDLGTPSPGNSFCAPWQDRCRVAINYTEHILPIFMLDRGADDFTPAAPGIVDPNNPTATPLLEVNAPNGIGDDTCTECHTGLNNNVQLPYGQLDLTIDPNQVLTDFPRSYQQMFITKQALDNALTPIPNTNVQPSMTRFGARRSYFIEKMTGVELDAARTISGTVHDHLPGSTTTHDHTAMLTGAELKLVSEWLDLGAQNFNDPFDPAAPQN